MKAIRTTQILHNQTGIDAILEDQEAVDPVHPLAAKLVRVVDDQNRIFGHEAGEQDHPDQAEQVDGHPAHSELACEPQAPKGADHRERQSHHH